MQRPDFYRNNTFTLPPRLAPAGGRGAYLPAKALKVTIPLDTATVVERLAPFATVDAKTSFVIAVEGRQVRCEFLPRQLRRVLAMISEHGHESVAVFVQGKLLADSSIGEAGLVAQIKVPKSLA